MDQPQDSPSAGRHANRRAPLAVSGLRSAPGASPAAHPRVQELGPPLGSPAGCSRPGHTPRRRGRVLDTWRHGSCGDAAGGADAGQAGRRAARGALQLRPRPAGRRAAEPAGPPPLSPADAGERPDESGATWAFGGWLGRPRGAGGHPARSSRMAFLLLPDRELLRVRVQVPEPMAPAVCGPLNRNTLKPSVMLWTGRFPFGEHGDCERVCHVCVVQLPGIAPRRAYLPPASSHPLSANRSEVP